jgi:hypothetical protein
MSRLHGNIKQTSVHWIESLKEIKYELNTKNYKKVTPLIRNKKISTSWVPFLTKKNILYKDDFYYWRFKEVNIDNKLIGDFRKDRDSYNFQNIKQSNTDLFTNVKTENKQPVKEIAENKNKMLSVKQAIKSYKVSDSTIRRFIRENKKVNPNKIMTSKGKIYIDKTLLDSEFNLKVEGQKEEIGLIRKFIKWLW